MIFLHSEDMARLARSPNKLFNMDSLRLSLATYFIRQWTSEFGLRLDLLTAGTEELVAVVNARELAAGS